MTYSNSVSFGEKILKMLFGGGIDRIFALALRMPQAFVPREQVQNKNIRVVSRSSCFMQSSEISFYIKSLRVASHNWCHRCLDFWPVTVVSWETDCRACHSWSIRSSTAYSRLLFWETRGFKQFENWEGGNKLRTLEVFTKNYALYTRT